MQFIKFSKILVVAVVSGFGTHAFSSGPENSGVKVRPTREERYERDFVEKAGKLNKLEERVQNAYEEYKKNVHKKNNPHADFKSQHEAMEGMKRTYKEYSTLLDELNSVRKEIRYRFPSQGKLKQERLVEVRKKTPTELESMGDLDSKLDLFKIKLADKYAPFVPEDEKKIRPNDHKKVEDSRPLRLEK